VPRVVGEVFALNVALVALALTSIEVNSSSARVVSLIVGTALVALLLYRFSTRKLH
jgi:hypothetical protein